MVEKIVRSLQDLEEALALAAGQGECRIKVGNKVAVPVASESLSDKQAEEFLSQPAVAQRLHKAARSLDEGRGISHADVPKLCSALLAAPISMVLPRGLDRTLDDDD